MESKRAIVVIDDCEETSTKLSGLVAAAAERHWKVRFFTGKDLGKKIIEECERIHSLVFQADAKVQLSHDLLDIVDSYAIDPICVILGVRFFGLPLQTLFPLVLQNRHPHASFAVLTDDARRPLSRHGISTDAASDFCSYIHQHIMRTACTDSCLHDR